VPLDRTRDLLILRAGRRLTEVSPSAVDQAEELGRDAGRAAASWVFDGSTPEHAYRQVLRVWGAKTRHRLLTCEYGCGGGPRVGSIAGL
jgi:hypothetical protein